MQIDFPDLDFDISAEALEFPDLDFDLPEAVEVEDERFIETRPIYTLDAETPPFEYEKMIRPFAWGLFDGADFRYTWGPDATARIEEKILQLPPGIIYMHNGGKFDIYFLIRLILGNKAFIVNRRIVRAYVELPGGGHHEIRDSYAIMPFPLRDFDKDEIDYEKFREKVREQHKEEILKYLEKDCVSLHRLCAAFIERFGTGLTIGGVAMKRLRAIHPFECLGPYADDDIRQHFYYGGRVQFFERGVLSGPWKVFDVNSMYPSVMKNAMHPMEMPGAEGTKVRADTCFITAEGKNYGAFPQRTKHDGLRFDIEDGTFHVTRHEWDTALDLGLFEPRKIIRCVNYRNRGTLAGFVDTYYSLRKQAKDSGDPFGTIFYKYILNSAYGKFAQNPEKYMEWKLDTLDSPEPDRGKRKENRWEEGVISQEREFEFKIWMRPSPDRTRFNIATGASITGAARAVLLRAIANAERPIYCDTDSIICRDLSGDGITIDSSVLGAWKEEHSEIDWAYIANRKLYALMKDPKIHGFEGPEELCKSAAKGVKLGPHQIKDVCEGKTVIYRRDAPTFRLDGSVQFIQRHVKLI